MVLSIYNTLTRKKDPFKPQKGKEVKMYICGPTVYGPDHLGHARIGIFYDVLRRYLEYRGYQVKMVQNITDVGHLTDDADSGEDKIEKEAKEADQSPQQIAQYYTQRHFNDMVKLKVKRPADSPKATEYIPQMIGFVKDLIEKGYAYQVGGNVYFDIKKFKDYGKLSNRKLEELKEAVRIDSDSQKKFPLDFALWLKADPNHRQKWDSPWGKGYPGWHLECSVMNRELLGDTVDIHGGANELIFPHHENEIAQSEALTGQPFVKYWVHIGLVTVNGEKMGKSKGNFITIRDLLKKCSVNQIRIALLSTYFRKPFDYSRKRMEQAQRVLDKLSQAKVHLQKEETPKLRAKMEKIMDNSINTPRLISFWLENKDQMGLKLFTDIENILGVEIGKPKVPANIKRKAEERESYRKSGNFKKADQLREQIESSGYQLKDREGGFEIWPKSEKNI